MIAARGSGVAQLMRKRRHHHKHHRHHTLQEMEVETSSSSSGSDSSDEDDQEGCRTISNITTSNKFSLAVATVIMLNVLLMGEEANYEDWYLPLQCTTDAVDYRRAMIDRIDALKKKADEGMEPTRRLSWQAPLSRRRLTAADAAENSTVQLHTLLVEGFPGTDGRSFLNGYYRERIAPEYQLGNHSTFWDLHGQRYIFFCPRVQSWGISSLSEWEANTEGQCIWGASTGPGANILEPSSGQFTSLFVNYTWTPITGAGVVSVIAEAAPTTTPVLATTTTATSTSTTTTTTTTWRFDFLIEEEEPNVLCSNFSLHVSVAEFAQSQGCVDVWQIVNLAFLVFFVFELTFRLITYRWAFFTSEDKWWNVFDFSIVLMGCVDAVIRFVSNGHTSSKLVTIVRVVRILRILRVLRLFRAFKKLTMLIRGLVESFTIVFWICLLMILFMVIYAIFCTTFIGQNADDYKDPDEIRMYFGSIKNSTVTLFQFLTLDNWSGITRMVWRIQPLMMPMFLIYVVVVSLVVVSLLTGVMAEHMNNVRESEEALEEQERQAQLKTATKVLYSAFKRVDEDENKSINFHEFQMVLADQELLDMLKTIELDLDDFDPHELFRCFDKDFDGALGWDEFRDGMEELRKTVGPKQLFKLQAAMQRVCIHQVQAETVKASSPSSTPSPSSKTFPMQERIMTPEVEELIGQVNEDMVGIDETLDTFEGDLKEFVTELRRRRKRGTL